MDKHFLISVSDQKSVGPGVRFLSDFFSDKRTVKATLFYSTPKAPAVWEKENSRRGWPCLQEARFESP